MADTKISALTSATTPLAGTEVVPVVQSTTTRKVSIANLTAGRAVDAGSLNTTTGGLTVTASEAYSTLSSSGGIGNNPRVRYRTVYTGGGSGYGGSFELESRQQNNVWNTGAFTVTDAGNVSTTGNFVLGTSGKGIDFSANTHAAGMTSELFNDYEEGTWTPVVTASSGTITTVGTVQGFYTKIGNLVFVWGTVQVTNNGTGAGVLLVAGLPFIPLATTQSASGCVGSGYNTSSGAMSLVRITGNSTQCQIARYDGLYPIGTGQTIGFSANYYV